MSRMKAPPTEFDPEQLPQDRFMSLEFGIRALQPFTLEARRPGFRQEPIQCLFAYRAIPDLSVFARRAKNPPPATPINASRTLPFHAALRSVLTTLKTAKDVLSAVHIIESPAVLVAGRLGVKSVQVGSRLNRKHPLC